MKKIGKTMEYSGRLIDCYGCEKCGWRYKEDCACENPDCEVVEDESLCEVCGNNPKNEHLGNICEECR